MSDTQEQTAETSNPVCVICQEPATNIFWGKALCYHHYELSRH